MSIRLIQFSTSFNSVNPKKSNFRNPLSSRCLKFMPSVQGVCNSPLTLINGMHVSISFSVATITPPACLPILLFSINKVSTCLLTSGYCVIKSRYFLEYFIQSACFNTNTDFSSSSLRACGITSSWRPFERLFTSPNGTP